MCPSGSVGYKGADEGRSNFRFGGRMRRAVRGRRSAGKRGVSREPAASATASAASHEHGDVHLLDADELPVDQHPVDLDRDIDAGDAPHDNAHGPPPPQAPPPPGRDAEAEAEAEAVDRDLGRRSAAAPGEQHRRHVAGPVVVRERHPAAGPGRRDRRRLAGHVRDDRAGRIDRDGPAAERSRCRRRKYLDPLSRCDAGCFSPSS
jgi:hypothetical protein